MGRGLAQYWAAILLGQDLVWIDDIYSNPSRVEDRPRKVSDGAGGLVEVMTKFPVWLDPVASNGTPMCHAFSYAQSILNDWVAKHPHLFRQLSFMSPMANRAMAILLSWLMRSGSYKRKMEICFTELASLIAHVARPSIFHPVRKAYPTSMPACSFKCQACCLSTCEMRCFNSGYSAGDLARGFVFNADIKDVVTFFEIGTIREQSALEVPCMSSLSIFKRRRPEQRRRV